MEDKRFNGSLSSFCPGSSCLTRQKRCGRRDGHAAVTAQRAAVLPSWVFTSSMHTTWHPQSLVRLSESCMSKCKASFYFSASVLHLDFFASLPSPSSPGTQRDAMLSSPDPSITQLPGATERWHALSGASRTFCCLVAAQSSHTAILQRQRAAHKKGLHHLPLLPLQAWSYQVGALRCSWLLKPSPRSTSSAHT